MRTVPTRASGPALGSGSEFEVVVIYTAVKPTLAALRTAGGLAQGLNGCIHLLVPQVVPFPTPLEQPPVQKSFTERKFRTIAEKSAVDTRVDISLCRDWEAAVLGGLKPRSVVVIATARRWWRPTREHRLARMLRKLGHHVVVVEERNA